MSEKIVEIEEDTLLWIDERYNRLRAENKRLHSIIKEVRENINKKLNINSDYVDYDYGTELLRQELLEILDKGE